MTEEIYPSDKQLAASAVEGDFEAFRAIVGRYSKVLLSVAYSILGDCHEAQDAVQETFVKCYQNLHNLKDPATA
ncbi:sigma factor [Paenibacillus woosongensis]|uniref:Sigma factor n=1 Tax=Paenibacillus woosongensis TaxID=307580 RepID=A0AA95I9I9_9BACL|nr:sigma factor [Paenibacillus woosongensis]WHX49007.1 sigma factor [Paenibacillus woosongensis]